MNRPHAFLLVLTLLYQPIMQPVHGDSARFDASSAMLSLPCVAVVAGQVAIDPAHPDLAYAFELQVDGAGLRINRIESITRPPECLAEFDVLTGILSDTLTAGIAPYTLRLRFERDDFFEMHRDILRRGGRGGHGESTLWRVSNGVHEVFIGGTIHALPAEDKSLPAVFTEAYQQAQILVTEISREDALNQNAIAPLLLNLQGPTLSEQLHESTYLQLSSYLDGIGLTIDSFELIRPVWVAQTLLAREMERLNLQDGVEAYFWELAAADGKPIQGLETSISQVLVVNETGAHLSADEKILQALESVQQGTLAAEIDALIRAWREGNLDFLAASVEADKEASPADHNLVLKDRNLDWLPQIEGYLTTPEKELILVGASHLAGSDNVLQMLEDIGMTVERYQ